MKCLEKEAENRYQSAKELAVDLRRLSTPSSANPITAADLRPQRRLVKTAIEGIIMLMIVVLCWSRSAPAAGAIVCWDMTCSHRLARWRYCP